MLDDYKLSTTMSGEIFNPPDSLDDLDVTRWNPLMCYLCNEKYEEPCILGCYHSFCSRCLSGRDVEGKMTCPLCGYVRLIMVITTAIYFAGSSRCSKH